LINYLGVNDILKAMEEESITGLGLIPPLWLQLLQHDWDDDRFPHWRYLTNTGGAMPEPAVRDFQRRLPDLKIYLMFGLTEAFRATYLPPDQVNNRPTSIGKAIPNAEIWVINENLEHCKPGEEGELVQRGAHVALGYWNDLERTRERFRPNPFAPHGLQIDEKVVFSGDRVRADKEGYIFFIGRRDEMIKTSGYRVSPTEIEEALYDTGKVKHAAAFGVPDKIQGQVVVAVVSLARGIHIDSKELITLCASTLANYMVPKQIDIWDNLPINSNGKIDLKSTMRQFMNNIKK
jgi:acyl-coenzyme A synthetase/AMP-(fatty) acid ligase